MHSDKQTSLDLKQAVRSAVPAGLVRRNPFPGVETPGYYRAVPLGQKPVWLNLILRPDKSAAHLSEKSQRLPEDLLDSG